MCSKNIEHGQKNCAWSKKIEHGQNIFELTDGLGKFQTAQHVYRKCCLSKISNAYRHNQTTPLSSIDKEQLFYT